jgi:hypothetical protein
VLQAAGASRALQRATAWTWHPGVVVCDSGSCSHLQSDRIAATYERECVVGAIYDRGRCSAANLLIRLGHILELAFSRWRSNVMWYLIAADLVLIAHLLFIGFVVGGSFLAWRWPWIIWVQLPAMVYGALVEFATFAITVPNQGSTPTCRTRGCCWLATR